MMQICIHSNENRCIISSIGTSMIPRIAIDCAS
ncbi:hypothetical protein AvCA_33760 [Azotobacter vinelandii CA]|uniref:Uncharacterized protein n=2 Tax=Azotobacter vinelandii TaxID=354 RepID=C1DPV5_AZOVD|nr:hypothetical protein Avin_33760 [Azotobacter vinelandii DJ]AGK14652.1 hypothetical protein AvCA_33760 [Azotobacter vinelandii CA]AGK21296.1 hypothetical protein AvCA6_33760 [Azotobacter vinelandii CA6]